MAFINALRRAAEDLCPVAAGISRPRDHTAAQKNRPELSSAARAPVISVSLPDPLGPTTKKRMPATYAASSSPMSTAGADWVILPVEM